MALWIDKNNVVHDDLGGKELDCIFLTIGLTPILDEFNKGENK